MRAHLRLEGVRVRFNTQLAAVIDDFKLIELTVVRARHKQLPDTHFAAEAHRMAAAIPEVEIAHHRDALRVRRPDAKARAVHVVNYRAVRAQGFVRAQMGAFRQQPGVHLLQQRPEAIGVVDQILLTVPVHRQLVAKHILAARHHRAEKAARIEAFQLGDFAPGVSLYYPYFRSVGQQRPDFQPVGCLVHPQQGEGIGVITRKQGIDRQAIGKL